MRHSPGPQRTVPVTSHPSSSSASYGLVSMRGYPDGTSRHSLNGVIGAPELMSAAAGFRSPSWDTRTDGYSPSAPSRGPPVAAGVQSPSAGSPMVQRRPIAVRSRSGSPMPTSAYVSSPLRHDGTPRFPGSPLSESAYLSSPSRHDGVARGGSRTAKVLSSYPVSNPERRTPVSPVHGTVGAPGGAGAVSWDQFDRFTMNYANQLSPVAVAPYDLDVANVNVSARLTPPATSSTRTESDGISQSDTSRVEGPLLDAAARTQAKLLEKEAEIAKAIADAAAEVANSTGQQETESARRRGQFLEASLPGAQAAEMQLLQVPQVRVLSEAEVQTEHSGDMQPTIERKEVASSLADSSKRGNSSNTGQASTQTDFFSVPELAATAYEPLQSPRGSPRDPRQRSTSFLSSRDSLPVITDRRPSHDVAHLDGGSHPSWKLFWQDFCKKFQEQNPQDPFTFLNEALETRKDTGTATVDPEKIRSLFEVLSEEAESNAPGIVFTLVDILRELIETDENDDEESFDSKELLSTLEWFGISRKSELNEKDFATFIEEATLASQLDPDLIEPHLMLNFDVNETVIMLDSVANVTEADCVNKVLADCCWGKHIKDQQEDGSETHTWVKEYPDPQTSCPQKGLVSYTEFVDVTNPLPKDKNDREGISKVRKAKKKLQTSFTSPGQPGESWSDLHRDMMEKLMLPPHIVGSKEADEAGLEGTSVLLLPCFINMILELKKSGRSFTLIFRTYGLDLGKIMKELNALCEGRHPMYKDAERLDGSDGEADYRMHLDSLARSGTWYREIDDSTTGGMIALIMGTVAQPSEKPQPGDLLGIPFYEHLKLLKDRQKEETLTVEEDGDNGIIILQEEEAINKYLSFCEPQTVALRDFFPSWLHSGKKPKGGKPIFIELNNLHEIHPIFFDDNIKPDNAKICDARNCRAYRKGKPGYLDIKKTFDLFLVQAEPLQSIRNPRYFLEKVQTCEARHRELMRRRASLGTVVKRMMELTKEELPQLIQSIRQKTTMQKILSRSPRNTMGRRVSWGENAEPDTGGTALAMGTFSNRLDYATGSMGLGPTSSMNFATGSMGPLSFRRSSTTSVGSDDEAPEEEIANALGAVKVIGLTSDISSGRSLVLTMLRDMGAIVIDCLKLKMQICNKGSQGYLDVRLYFEKHGLEVCDEEDGGINHLTVAYYISRDAELRKGYDLVMKPHLMNIVFAQIREHDEECQVGIYYNEDPWMCRRVVVVDTVNIVETGLNFLVEEVWLVQSDRETRIKSMLKKGLFPESKAGYLIDEYTKRDWDNTPPDVIINNDRDRRNLLPQVTEAWRKLHLRMYGMDENCDEVVVEIVNPEDHLIGAAPISHVFKAYLWHRMVFVVLRHQKSGGFLATQRARTKAYMPGRWDFSLFGRPQFAAVPVGGTPEAVASQALRDKLGVDLHAEGFSKVTSFVYRGALSAGGSPGGRISFVGYVYEAFLDLTLSKVTLPDRDEVEDVKIFSASESLAMMQEELVPMTARAFDMYTAHFLVGEGVQRMPNLVATPGAVPSALVSNQGPWVKECDNFSCGITLVGLLGDEFSSRREVGEFLGELGAIVIDCHTISKRCYEKGTMCFNEIVDRFGDAILGEDGEVNARLLGPMLHARPEMLLRFQTIIQKNLMEILRRRIAAIQNDHRDKFNLPGGHLHTVRKAVVLDCSVFKECGMDAFVDEEWWVVNNYDTLTRRRFTNAQASLVGVKDPHWEVRRSSMIASQKSEIQKVTFKVEKAEKLRHDVLDQWCLLHKRMYQRLGNIDVESLEKGPYISIESHGGHHVGVAPLSFVHENGLAHKTCFIVIRHSGGVFYSMRKKPEPGQSTGEIDLVFFGPSGIRELRTGEHPADAAARIVQTLINVDSIPHFLGELPYQEKEDSGMITGMIFELILTVPISSLIPNPDLVDEILMLDTEQRFNIPQDQMSTLSSCIFAHFWSLSVGGDNTLMYR